MKDRRTILGVDPGTQMVGWGVVELHGTIAHYRGMGTISLKGDRDPYGRLATIFKEISALILEYSPGEMAIEAPFYGKNVQSMLKLGRAQGIAIAAAMSVDIPVYEYAPRKIKQAITGRGGASKEQVALMVCSMLKIERGNHLLDATDALAAALCHSYTNNIISDCIDGRGGATQSKKRSSSWSDFIEKNPDRLK
ncbi:MAG: crossover junction endodeoxyribonuclease RuvC [Bacteroidales bacterium]